MQVADKNGLPFAGLCMPLPIKDSHFRGTFGGLRVAFGMLYRVRIIARIIEFSLSKTLARGEAQRKLLWLWKAEPVGPSFLRVNERLFTFSP